jgi:hypothetical protein
MLRRGALAQRLGQRAAELERLASTIGVAPEPGAAWLDRILAAPAQFDPGEAQLLALAAEHAGVFLITGDKRAVEGIRTVDGLAEALRGRIVTIEAAFITLCGTHGVSEVKNRAASVLDLDASLRACFSSADSLEGLKNYQATLAARVPAGLLWTP